MPRFLVNPGTPQQWELPLKNGTNILGRSPACDAQIEHESVSGTHCEVTLNGASVMVRDLGSTNGTFLNKAPVQQTVLSPGQRLQLGGVELEFIPDPESRPTAAAPVSEPVVMRLATPPAPAPVTAPNIPVPPPRPLPPSSPSPAATLSPSPSTPSGSPPMAAPRVSLRVTAHEAPPPPPQSGLPALVVEEYAAEATAPAQCRYHPKALARYLCPQCQLNYCELCVTNRPGGARTGWFCRKCAGECVALNVQLMRQGSEKENFFTALPGAFSYPFKGKGLTFLICGTLFLSLLNFLGNFGAGLYLLGGVAIFLKIFALAFTFAYIQRVIQTAAQGSDDQAEWPDVSDFWQDMIVPCFQLVMLSLICLGPGFAMTYFVGADVAQGSTLGAGHIVLIAIAFGLGAIYAPMAFLSLAMFDSVAGLNPLVVVPAIMRVPVAYLTVLIVTVLIVAVGAAQQFAAGLLPIPVLPALLASGVGLYFLTVQGRLLGLLYYANRQKLGWFNLRT